MHIKVSLAKGKETPSEEPTVVDDVLAIFNKRNLLILGTGLALGVILRQQSEIRSLKRTADILQEALRGRY